MRQTPPNKLAVPGASIGAPREVQPAFLKATDHAVGGPLLLKQLEHRPDSSLHLLIGIEDDPVVLEHQANRQGKAQLAPGGFVELTTVEARANDVQLCLSEGSLHTKHKGVVEVGRTVHTILVDHERPRDGTQLEEAMPVLVRACQPRRLQAK